MSQPLRVAWKSSGNKAKSFPWQIYKKFIVQSAGVIQLAHFTIELILMTLFFELLIFGLSS
jgi:hypothetical protein